MSLKNKAKKINFIWVFLFIIFFIGLILRLVKLNYFSRLEPDEGRDLLVARHIALFGDNLVLGHDASGIEGLFYGPYYYYLLAFFNLINDNPYFIFFLI